MSTPSASGHSVLSTLAIGYSPFIGKTRQVVATRITVAPARADTPPDAAALLQALLAVWPLAEGAALLQPGAAAEAGASIQSFGGSAAGKGGAPVAPEQPLNLTLRRVEGAPSYSASGDAKAGYTVPAKFSAAAAAATKAAPVGRATATPVLALVSLNIADEAWLRAVMAQALPAHFMIEVPAFMAADPAFAAPMADLQARGIQLLLKGRPLQPLTPAQLACFSHAVVETEEERRALPAAVPGTRRLGLVQSGVRTSAAAGQAFERDALAVLGWPLDDPLPVAGGARQSVPPDVQVVLELINGVDKDLPANKLEALLKREPTLAFRLMRYLNSPAFGLSVEINSFGHALMLLGSQRLKRWLALLLASASKSKNAQPLMHAAVRRGLFMEELAKSQSSPGDAELRGQMFICGVFSLLDKLLGQSFADMLPSLPVPETVQQALLGQGGPFGPYLALVNAVEQEAAYDIREAADSLMLDLAEVNQALLRALLTAKQLDG